MKRKVFTFTIILIIFCMLIPNVVFGINTSLYKNVTEDPGDLGTVNRFGGKILGIINVVGMGLAILVLLYIGVKYIMASPSEKADYKERILPYVIGVAIFLGAIPILKLIISFLI